VGFFPLRPTRRLANLRRANTMVYTKNAEKVPVFLESAKIKYLF